MAINQLGHNYTTETCTFDKTEFYTYNKMQFISNYLRLLCKNEYTITDTKFSLKLLKIYDIYKNMKLMFHTMLNRYS